jgi:hypothetical protein
MFVHHSLYRLYYIKIADNFYTRHLKAFKAIVYADFQKIKYSYDTVLYCFFLSHRSACHRWCNG